MFTECLIALICWTAPFRVARRFVCRILPDESMPVRWTATGLLAILYIVLTCEALGAIGWLNRWTVLAGCLLVTVTAARIQPPPSLSIDWRHFLVWLRLRIRDGYGILFCLAALLIAQAVMRALRCPPLSWDSLTYHAFLPARWVQLGAIEPFASPGGMDNYRAFPINLELLVVWAMLPFGNDLAINLINLPVMLLAAVSLYGLARQLGAPPRLALWAPAIFCTSPPLWSMITTQYSDILVTSLTLAALLFTVRFMDTRGPRMLLIAAIAFGLACGTRYSGLQPAGLTMILLIGMLAVAGAGSAKQGNAGASPGKIHRGKLRSSGPLAGAALLAIAVGGFQYWRNLHHLGNPIYPIGVEVAGQTLFEGSKYTEDVLHRLPAGDRMHDWRHFRQVFAGNAYCWGGIYLGLLPIALFSVIPSRRRTTRAFTEVMNARETLPLKPTATHGLLSLLWIGLLIAFYAPDGDHTSHVRRMWPLCSQRLLAVSMALICVLAVARLRAINWPRGGFAVVPTLAVLATMWTGQYPQSLSYTECATVLAAAMALLWLTTANPRMITGWMSSVRMPQLALRILVLAAVLALLAQGAARQIDKRRQTRHHHYARSIDYDDLPRGLAAAWRACDEPDRPHVVAMTRPRVGNPHESAVTAGNRWFFYPLLGGELQNRVVYASIFEPDDEPDPPYYLDHARIDFDRRTWLANLQRLGVDRFLLVKKAWPEADWIDDLPDIFKPLDRGDEYVLFSIQQLRLAAQLGESGLEPRTRIASQVAP